jgi:diacylglycerol kinase (ATP)
MTESRPHRVAPGLFRALRALRYSIAGLRAAWQHEEAFRQEVLLILGLLPLAQWLGENGVERALLAGCLLLVLIVEVLNSALEAAVDRFGPARNELVGRAKDMGSAAVFLALCNAGLVWGLVLLG